MREKEADKLIQRWSCIQIPLRFCFHLSLLFGKFGQVNALIASTRHTCRDEEYILTHTHIHQLISFLKIQQRKVLPLALNMSEYETSECHNASWMHRTLISLRAVCSVYSSHSHEPRHRRCSLKSQSEDCGVSRWHSECIGRRDNPT